MLTNPKRTVFVSIFLLEFAHTFDNDEFVTLKINIMIGVFYYHKGKWTLNLSNVNAAAYQILIYLQTPNENYYIYVLSHPSNAPRV